MPVGAFLGNLGLARRKERREAVGAARAVSADLEKAVQTVRFALSENDWSSLHRRDLEVRSWAGSQPILGQSCSSAEWSTVLAAVRSADLLWEASGGSADTRRIYPTVDPAAPPDGDRFELESAVRELEDGILALEKYAKWQEPADEVREIR